MKKRYLNLLSIAILVLTEALIIASLFLEISQERKSAITYAENEARLSIDGDIMYRKWVSSHGGVYVPITDDVPPNPYLKVPNRDVTINGKPFTLVNPAYMTRQVYEQDSTVTGIKGHITSINPIRPQNEADTWEKKALKQFEDGISEVSNIEKMEGEDYLRYMRPFYVDKTCLKCHAEQGYKVGDIRGGLSVSVPMKTFYSVSNDRIRTSKIIHGFTFFIF